MTTDGSAASQRWARVTSIFHDALDQPPDVRAAFIRDACGDDPDLRAEVESLVAAHDRADSFIEQPAAPVSAVQASERILTESSSSGSTRPIDDPDDGAVDIPAGPIRRGSVVGPYRIERLIASGGMGVVYLAEDTRLGRLVALKAVRPDLSADAKRRDRLRREARAAALLNHPSIATVYALEEFDGHFYMASEYVPGPTLRDVLRAGPLPTRRVRALTLELARALHVAHERGIIHRDIKPENIIAVEAGVKILDFGLAHLDEPLAFGTLTAEGHMLGTPAYMAPEQLRGAPADVRSDIFALGIVLYELTTGTHPFGTHDVGRTIAAILESAPAPVPARPAGDHGDDDGESPLASGLIAVALRCLSKNPADRFQSAADVAVAIEHIGNGIDGKAAFREPSGSVAARTESGVVGRTESESPAAVAGGAPPPVRHAARWWWQFHQGAAAVIYVLLLVPLWHARAAFNGDTGAIVFLVGLAAVAVASTVRLHLWFASRVLSADWIAHLGRTRLWLHGADFIAVGALLAAGWRTMSTDAPLSLLLVAAGACAGVSAAVVEPATTRAAFAPAAESRNEMVSR